MYAASRSQRRSYSVRQFRTKLVLATQLIALLGVFTASTLSAAPSKATFEGGHVTITSKKSFDEVTKAVESLVTKNGMMVMGQVNQGKMLSMTGLRLDATLFLIGNPTVGKKLFEQNRAVGLYVPLRLFVYGDGNGETHISYDQPSSLLGQFEKKEIVQVAKMLDEKLEGLAQMAAQ